jgi:hypothetical protein
MSRVLGRNRLSVAAAVSLLFAVLLFGAPAPSAAATYTLHFAGAVASSDPGDIFEALGIVAGDAVSGTMTLDPFNENPTTVNASSSQFDQPSVSYTFHVSHPGKVDLTFSDSGNGNVASGGTPLPFRDFGIDLAGATSRLTMFLETDANGPALLSLAGLPTTPAGILALLGGNVTNAFGAFELTGFGRLEFGFAAAPIPPALPLFVSALAGLGFVGWRHRSAHGTA